MGDGGVGGVADVGARDDDGEVLAGERGEQGTAGGQRFQRRGCELAVRELADDQYAFAVSHGSS